MSLIIPSGTRGGGGNGVGGTPTPTTGPAVAFLTDTTATLIIAPVEGAEGYQLQQRKGDGPWEPLGAMGNSSRVISNLEPGTRYQFRAFVDGSSEAGPILTVNTPALPSAPGAPRAFSAAESTETTIAYTFAAPNTGDPATAYYIAYRAVGSNTWLNTQEFTTLGYTVTGLQPETIYEARAYAKNDVGTSGPSGITTLITQPLAEIAYTMASRPIVSDIPEGGEIRVTDLPIGTHQRRVNGNYLTVRRDVIIDTDFWTDSDDVTALRIAYQLEKLGHINIKGIALSTTQDIGPGALEALMIAEGRLNNRISVPLTPHTPTHGVGTFQPGLFALPHNLGAPETVENAVTMYRDILANATNKVDLILIGFQNNLAELLASPADAISPMTGLQLVNQKVNMLYAMAGHWVTNVVLPGATGEYNVAKTPQALSAAVSVFANWPTPIIFSGYEIGYDIFSGAGLEAFVGSDVVADAMQSHGDFAGTPKGRPSWDPLEVLLGGLGVNSLNVVESIKPHGYTVVRGTATIDSGTGATTMTVGSTGKHYVTTKVNTNAVFRGNLDSLLIPSQYPSQAPINQATLFPMPLANNVAMSYTDYDRLLEAWVAQEVAGDDGSGVATWPGVKRAWTAVPRDPAKLPTLWYTVGGLRALQFASLLFDTPTVSLPPEVTIYAMGRFPTTPNTTRSLVSQDRGSSSGQRTFHLKTGATVKSQFVGFSGTAGVTDTSGTGAVNANEWHVFAGVRHMNSVEAFFNGVGDGPTVLPNNTPGDMTISFGGRGVGNEYLTGDYLHAIRIYYGAHDAATVAAITQEMMVGAS